MRPIFSMREGGGGEAAGLWAPRMARARTTGAATLVGTNLGVNYIHGGDFLPTGSPPPPPPPLPGQPKSPNPRAMIDNTDAMDFIWGILLRIPI